MPRDVAAARRDSSVTHQQHLTGIEDTADAIVKRINRGTS